MRRTVLGSLVGALAVTSLAAASAAAAGPATVDVRVVGLRGPIAEAVVTTTTRKVVKDGTHACSGTSAAGALQLATGGRWTASWFDGLGYSIDAVEGVRPALPDYWTLWINDRASTTGLCDTELQDGDDVLAFVCTDADPATYACGNRPLGLIAPRSARGRTVTVRTVAYADDGSAVPAPGATVAGGVRSVRSDARGVARVQLRPEGQTALVATRAGDVQSARTLCAVTAAGARCGSQDTTAPLLKVTNVRDGQTFRAATAPRVLRGVAKDPAGAIVELRLTRRVQGSCSAYLGNRETFVACPRRGAPWFMASDRAAWSYLLPAKLGPGRYTLGVLASDANGNVSRLTLRFSVQAAR
jgi:hypothetical protein